MIAEAAGDVTINHCEFVNNHLYNTAIYYLSNKGNHSDDIHELLINNCNFTYNLGGTSIMYVGTSQVTFSLRNSVFYKNQGNPMYISISDTVIFEENLAEDAYGGEILADKNSSISFHTNSIVNVS